MNETINNNPLLCNPEKGICEIPNATNQEVEIHIKSEKKTIHIIYFTDPICSACWAIEPELKKFKLEYGEYVDIEYRMGGLVRSWEGFADKSNGIYSPKDVAPHWDEVGQHSGMSIDGDIWLEDPLSSSYPPSIAFKAMQKQGDEKALQFLRYIREMVFLEKKNITKEHHLIEAVKKCGGDTVQFLADYHSKVTEQSFYAEIKEGRDLGVRGFPTFIFIGKDGTGFRLPGISGYENYVLALEKALDKKLKAKPIHYTEIDVISKYGYLATKEISFVLSQDEATTIVNLEQLEKEGKVKKVMQKYGLFWRVIKL